LDLRERLIQQLVDGSLECLICLDKVKPPHAIWACPSCYQIFHIHCIKKWSKTNKNEDGGGIRCPAGCGHILARAPRDYRCFCGRVRDPEWTRGRETPHSCAEVCNKERKGCTHRCTELCHPGPCPECMASTKIFCGCGKTSRHARCGTKFTCDAVCGKKLSCGGHTCQRPCHHGECAPCPIKVPQQCHCGKQGRQVDCSPISRSTAEYACLEVCDRTLDCGNHQCTLQCHPGDCPDCPLTPEAVTTCPCGKTSLEKIYERDGAERRTSCQDPVPTCGMTCGRLLECGPPSNRHTCQAPCHEGPCPPCPQTTEVRCRCGYMEKEMDCADLTTRADDARCEKRCNRKRDCGRHKCGKMCCIEEDHPCPLTCGRMLSCGKHRCEEPCHRGPCQPCPQVSFDDLYCHCGVQVTMAPIACGTKPPACDQPCARHHPCSHEVRHSCHSDEDGCPPCTELVEKWCYGRHELRKAVFCHVEGISCGRPCGKELPCGRHDCDRLCHDGQCLEEGQTCKQKCKEPRESCGHPCGAPCHDGPCPGQPCRERVTVKCSCGHLSAVRPCGDSNNRMSLLAAAQMNSGSNGSSVDLAALARSAKTGSHKLDCNEECAVIERNRRLALALQVENPNDRTKAPTYSEFMKDVARKDPAFSQMVHNKLTELVKLAKASKQRSRQYSFDCMNREKRQFVHEYTDHFGVDSESFDAEPKRNVVATAVRDRVWIPTQSLNAVIQGQRKVAGPMNASNGSNFGKKSCSSATLSSLGSTNAWTARTAATVRRVEPRPPPVVIDPFDD